MRRPQSWPRVVFGVGDLLVAAVIAYTTTAVVPSRHGWFQVLALVLATLLALGGAGILTGRRQGLQVGLAAAGGALVAGLAVVWGLLASAAYLHGTFGGFGQGAAIVLGVVVLLVAELLCLPAIVQLWWLRRRLRLVERRS